MTESFGAALSPSSPIAPSTRQRRRFTARILSLPGQKVAWSILFVLVSAAVLAPLLAPHSPNVQDLTSTLAPPNGEHLLGTDDLGRDQLSRLLFGLRTSLAISAAVTLGVMIIGLPLGMLAGFTRGIANTVIARVIDVGLALLHCCSHWRSSPQWERGSPVRSSLSLRLHAVSRTGYTQCRTQDS